MSIEECQRTTSAREFEDRFQQFCEAGHPAWIPSCVEAAMHMQKFQPRSMMRTFVGIFLSPIHAPVNENAVDAQFDSLARMMGFDPNASEEETT